MIDRTKIKYFLTSSNSPELLTFSLLLALIFMLAIPISMNLSLKILIGGLASVLLPGLFLAKYFFPKSKMSTFELVSFSAIISICNLTIWTIISVILRLDMSTMVFLNILSILILYSLHLLNLVNNFSILQVRALKISFEKFDIFFWIAIFILARASFNWGETPDGVGGEALLHLFFTRQYFDQQFLLSNFGLDQGELPPNIIHMWEFTLAYWAKLANIDPLQLFDRARFIIPVLGLSAFIAFYENIFKSTRSKVTIGITLFAIVLSNFILVSPSPLDWLKADPLRGVFNFMGTVHRADFAMETLYLLGLFLLALNTTFQPRKLLLISTIFFVATLMFHAREFFQLLLNWGMLIFIVPLVSSKTRIPLLKKWAKLLFCFIGIGIFLVILNKFLSSEMKNHTSEFTIKLELLALIFNSEILFNFNHLFHFPISINLGNLVQSSSIDLKTLSATLAGSKQTFLWLVTSNIGANYLLVFGTDRERLFTKYYLILWITLFISSALSLLVIAGTYSEFYMTSSRLLYIFSILTIGCFVYRIASCLDLQFISKKLIHLGITLAFLLFLVFLFSVWPLDDRFFEYLAWFLTILTFANLLFPYLVRRNLRPLNSESKSKATLCIVLLIIFLSAFICFRKETTERASLILFKTRKGTDWYGPNNPLGVSSALLRELKKIPKNSRVDVDPLGKVVLPIYTPVYLTTVPYIIKTVLRDSLVYERVRNNEHPIFFLDSHERVPNRRAFTKYLKANSTKYLVLQNHHFDFYKDAVRQGSEFEILFQDDRSKELLVKYNGL